MEFSKAVKKVREDECFVASDGYLAHGFFSEEQWQVGFYSDDTDTITAYTVGSLVVRGKPEEVFKDGGSVAELKIEDVSLSHTKALDIATSELAAKHPNHPVTKPIVLVQTIAGVAAFNITLVTATLHMYNIKINASSGEIISDVFDSILSLKAE